MAASPVVPQATMASMPPSIWNSTKRSSSSQAMEPSSWKGVTKAVAAPVKIICFIKVLLQRSVESSPWQPAAPPCSTRAARGAPQGVVGQAHKFVVILGVGAQAADGNGHAALQIPVQFGLGPVVFARNSAGTAWARWAAPAPGRGLGNSPSGALISSMAGLVLKGDEHSRRVAVGHGHPQALGGDGGGGRR